MGINILQNVRNVLYNLLIYIQICILTQTQHCYIQMALKVKEKEKA